MPGMHLELQMTIPWDSMFRLSQCLLLCGQIQSSLFLLLIPFPCVQNAANDIAFVLQDVDWKDPCMTSGLDPLHFSRLSVLCCIAVSFTSWMSDCRPPSSSGSESPSLSSMLTRPNSTLSEMHHISHPVYRNTHLWMCTSHVHFASQNSVLLLERQLEFCFPW